MKVYFPITQLIFLALLLTALEKCTTEVHVQSENQEIQKMQKLVQPGERWMVYGPLKYLPQKEISIIEKRRKQLFSKTEGVYVRNISTGKIFSIIGRSYLLKPDEELFNMSLGPQVLEILQRTGLIKNKIRKDYEVVTYYCPFNSAVQIYDFQRKKSRIEFGPKLVILEPYESFTIASLSGGKPKKPNQFQFFSVWLGPDFSTDIIIVETSDHATLQLQLSYNWEFIVQQEDAEANKKIFIVKDFIGDLCTQLASAIRSSVAQQTFENFHKNCARIIRIAIFGFDENGKIKRELIFEKNGLKITNVDIQTVSPVNTQIQNSLQKIVSLAIEATTNRQEANARQEAQILEQKAKNKARSEQIRVNLIDLKSQSNSVMQKGTKISEATAQCVAQSIAAETQLKVAELQAKAKQIKAIIEMQNQLKKQEVQQLHEALKQQILIEKEQKLAEIEATKYSKAIQSIGSEQITKIAIAGPELQLKFLKGLGLKGYILKVTIVNKIKFEKDQDQPITFLDSIGGAGEKINVNF